MFDDPKKVIHLKLSGEMVEISLIPYETKYSLLRDTDGHRHLWPTGLKCPADAAKVVDLFRDQMIYIEEVGLVAEDHKLFMGCYLALPPKMRGDDELAAFKKRSYEEG